MRVGEYLAAALIAAQGVVAMAGEPFTVRILVAPDRIPLGIPLSLVVQVENVSGAPVRVAFFEKFPPVAVIIKSQAGEQEYCPVCKGDWTEYGGLLPEAWLIVAPLKVPLMASGAYTLQAILKHFRYETEKPAKYPDVWWGESLSEPVKVEVTAPEGVDKEAYEAFGEDPLGDHSCWGELLRRFPASTYAAYLVWDLSQIKGLAGRDPAWLADTLARGTDRLWNQVPSTGGGWTSLRGSCLVDWRRGWLERILEHHPDIWFADELRLELAFDSYLLGDEDACEVGLEDLAEDGRPYVATKAAQLLDIMKAKGMLGEEEH